MQYSILKVTNQRAGAESVQIVTTDISNKNQTEVESAKVATISTIGKIMSVDSKRMNDHDIINNAMIIVYHIKFNTVLIIDHYDLEQLE